MSFLFKKKEKKDTPPEESPRAVPAGGIGSTTQPYSASSMSQSLAVPNSVDESKGSASAEDPEVLAIRKHFAEMKLSKKTFVFGDTLGTGTFGRVRLVTYSMNKKIQYFALKMLKKSEIIRLKQVEHIKSEKAILNRIAHPFVVSLYATFADERCLYMLMEFIIGGELFSQLRKAGRFVNDTARFYAAEITLAFAHLHEKDIVYRDLKPENLLIDKDGHVKITDFGFAKVVPDRTWTLCGTPEYLAPEIIQSKGHGKGVDWWALGILIYEMLAGYPPFYDENPFGIYQKILAGKIDFPRHFDPYGKELVKKLLTADRTKRFGCLKDGPEDIKQHKWFKGIDWAQCYQRKIKPPYVPLAKAPNDTSNFDKYPESAGQDVKLTPKDQALFDDF